MTTRSARPSHNRILLGALAVAIAATGCGQVTAPNSDAAADGPAADTLARECLMDSHCNDNNPCTRDECDANGLCQATVIAGSCDDGDLCTDSDTCDLNGECIGEPVQCDTGRICDPGVGVCLCEPGALDCGGVCIAGAVCCPGQNGGTCGRCGTSLCNNNGQWICTDEHGVCDPGQNCQYPNAPCDVCGPGQQRVCNEGSCNWGGCFP